MMTRLAHWLGWCRPGHCPLDDRIPAGSPVLTWLADLGYGVEPCECGRPYCQGWKIT